jgi:hypothetical protein
MVDDPRAFGACLRTALGDLEARSGDAAAAGPVRPDLSPATEQIDH